MAFQVRIIDSDSERQVRQLLERRTRNHSSLQRRVARIVADVRQRGDAAVLDYARRFDQLTRPIEVTTDEMRAAPISKPCRRSFPRCSGQPSLP